VRDSTTEVRLARSWYEEGCDAERLARSLGRGEIVRIRHGAYASAHAEQAATRHRQLIAATLPRLGSDAVLSHTSAAILHGLPLWPDSLLQLHVTVRTRSSGGRRTPQLHVHPGPLDDEDTVSLDGWPATSLARTAADLARTVSLDRAVAFADAALRLGLPRSELERHVHQADRRHGVGQLRFVTAFADQRAESVGESRSRLIIHQVGLPSPEPQYEIVDPATGVVLARCDFGWEEHRTLGEYDGKVKYGRLLEPGQDPGDVVYDEKRREDMLRDLGHEVARWTSPDLRRPATIRDRVLRAFARGDRR
jgi:hypothetical protein